ncbi:hypothetical protein FXF51_56025 [Nonomuraea sp. PA05]|uniref:hypothetical protein n=1 Tax=Nonomuraea sp. PA05 TaxID=2604466 RepID=UPI0011D7D1EA|nr:hypothetical protein [Nonomuraea sp. PA05]TYB50475.1 hypothetical protein FXF51_56025 [Nonomuraea sp. PA05]
MSEFPTSGRSGHPEPRSEHGTVSRAGDAAAHTAHTATQQARQVGGEIRQQTGQAVTHLRGRVRDEVDSQSRRAAQNLRHWADELREMTESGKPDSPVQGVLQRVAGTGHKAADYLEDQGLGGAVGELQDFARRRPGVFLAGALAAGFLFGRLVKASAAAAQDDDRPRQDDWQRQGDDRQRQDDWQRQDIAREATPAPRSTQNYEPVGPVADPPSTYATAPTEPPSTYATAPTEPVTPVAPPVQPPGTPRYPEGEHR